MLADLCAVCALLLPDRIPRLLLLGQVVEGPVQSGLARPAPARPRRLAERPARDQVRAGAARPRRGLRGEVWLCAFPNLFLTIAPAGAMTNSSSSHGIGLGKLLNVHRTDMLQQKGRTAAV